MMNDTAAGESGNGAAPATATTPAMVGNISQRAHEAIDKATSHAERTADWLGQKQQAVKDSQKQLVEDASAYISANPLKAIGIALGAGLILSKLLFGGRRHPSDY
jgi:ElaB/YqjD/DUF883 family membrane-anchored ribosome-binding protein